MLIPAGLTTRGSLPRWSESAASEVVAATLANGLQVLVWPDARIPNVVLHHWVKAGSRNELVGSTGLAHFFEHMMFNGTRAHPLGDFDRLLEGQGGSNNAFTSADVTVFQVCLPRAALPLALQLEADRFADLALLPQIVENERRVVAAERRLHVEDDAVAQLEEQVQARAFERDPYGTWSSLVGRYSVLDAGGSAAVLSHLLCAQ